MFLKNALKEMDTFLKPMEVDVLDETSLACVSGKPLIIVKRLVMKIQIVSLLRFLSMNAIYLHRVHMPLPMKTISDSVFM